MGKKIFLKGAISPRQDTLANWTKENPILEKGEMGIVTDSKGAKWLKLGDGVTPFCDLPYKETGAEVDAIYNPESANAQSGKAVAEGINQNIGDINSVLAAVIKGSAALPQSIIDNVIKKAASGVESKIGNRFVTAVAVKDTGIIEIEPNSAYFILSNNENGKILLFDRTTEEPVEFTGKMIGLITGNYGDANPSSVLGFTGIYSSAVIVKGTYLALDKNKKGSLSWEGESTVITVKNVSGI